MAPLDDPLPVMPESFIITRHALPQHFPDGLAQGRGLEQVQRDA